MYSASFPSAVWTCEVRRPSESASAISEPLSLYSCHWWLIVMLIY